MDKVEKITERGDQYAKRLLIRKKEQNQSPECYSKSLQRRLSIIEAIRKSNMTTPSNIHYGGNPFEREFAAVRGSRNSEIVRKPHQQWDQQNPTKTRPSNNVQDGIELTSPSNSSNPLQISTAVDDPSSQTYCVDSSETTLPSMELRPIPGRTSSSFTTARNKFMTDANFNDVVVVGAGPDHRYRRSSVRHPRESPPPPPPPTLDHVAVQTVESPPSQIEPCSLYSNGDGDSRRDVDGESRFSLGEYFGAKSHRDLNPRHFLGKTYEEELEQGNTELRRKGPDLFFEARVLEVLEPEVVTKIEQPQSCDRAPTSRRRVSDITFIRESLREIQLRTAVTTDDESMSMSLVSEDIREIDREIEQLQFQPDLDELVAIAAEQPTLQPYQQSQQHQFQQPQQHRLQQSQPGIAETPKSIYPSLSLVRRGSDNFTPKKLFHNNDPEKFEEKPGTDLNSNTMETIGDYQNQTSLNDKTFTTPMPMPPASQLSDLDDSNQRQNQQHDSSAMSFLKRNASFLSNLPKLIRRKPNLESTRKIFSDKTASPLSQEGTTISTLTLPNTPSSPHTYEPIGDYQRQQQQLLQQQVQSVQRNKENTLPFEVEHFFELAVGGEHDNSTVTFAQSDVRDRTNSHVNASELISEERTPLKNRIRKVMRVPASEPPKPSSTLNRTLTIYKTLTHRIKKRFRENSKEDSRKKEAQSIARQDIQPTTPSPRLNDRVTKLLGEVDIQQTLIHQASKALDLCNSMREFMASPERVEYERVLVLANLRKRAIQEEISRASSRRDDDGLYCERGEVTLKDLSLQLREDVLRRERQSGDIVEWFVIIVSEGLTVWATEAVECPSSSSRMYFPGQLSIPGLTPDFRLNVNVYSLMLQNIPYNHEDKYHITRCDGYRHSTTCPSPKKLLWRSEKRRTMISPKQYEIRVADIKKSSFLLCGSIELMLHDLNLKSPWPLMSVPSKSVLHGTIDLSLTCSLQLSVSHAGFLTHGDEIGGCAAWNRRWCVLEGHTLLFWNYPCEQEPSKKKPPLYAIDLINCVSRHIGLIDRSLCARARTLLVETVRSRSAVDRNNTVVECRSSCTIVRNLLSCDTNQELTEWQSKLNHVVSALREWNIKDTKIDL